MGTEEQTIEDGMEEFLDGFEGEVTDADLTDSLSAESAVTRVLTDDSLESGVQHATVTRLDFGESEYDSRDQSVCKVYYTLGGLEWVAEFDPRRSRDRQRLGSLLARHDVSTYAPADLVGRDLTVVVSNSDTYLVVDESYTHADISRAWDGWKYRFISGMNTFGARGLLDMALSLTATILMAALLGVFISASLAGAVLFIGVVFSLVGGIFIPLMGVGGPDPDITGATKPVFRD